jgi:hypothetical protein
MGEGVGPGIGTGVERSRVAGSVARSKKRGAPRPWVVRCAGRINRSGVALEQNSRGRAGVQSLERRSGGAAARRADAPERLLRRRNNRSGRPPGFSQKTNPPERGCLGTGPPRMGWGSIVRTTKRRCGGAKGRRAGATFPGDGITEADGFWVFRRERISRSGLRKTVRADVPCGVCV